jgi:glycosyltransferase involved in cell wall biosynthesis
MNILFSITYYTPYVSGLTLCARRIAEGLAGRGHQVTMLTMRHDTRVPEHETIDGVRVVRAGWIAKVSKGFVSIDWLVKSWREVVQADTVIINLPQFEGIVPAIFAKLRGKKLLSIYHCEVVLPPGFLNSVVQSLLEVSNFLTLLLSDEIVTYTSDYAEHSRLPRLLRLLLPAGRQVRLPKIKAIYPPIPTPITNPVLVKKFRKQIGETDIVIGVAARLAAEKGIEYLLEAIPLVCHPGLRAGIHENKSWIPGQARNDKKIKIVIAGSMQPVGEEAYKKKILALVQKYKDQVVFLGEVSPHNMGSFYRLLDVLVLPSINSTEAFGMVQVEAMLLGVPVVVSNLSGVRVPIQKTGMGIVVPPKSIRGIAQAINAILADKQTYMRTGNQIAHEFSMEKSIESYEQLV